MIKNKLVFTFYLVLFLSFFSCKSEEQKKVDKNAIIDSTITAFQKTLLEQQIDSVFVKNSFNANVLVVKDSTIIYEKENGFQDFKTKTPLSIDSEFAIASVSKQFTAVLILQQLEAGKLKLEDKVSQYLPEFQNKTLENINIQKLLNHSSGFNTLNSKLEFPVGTGFYYSNEGFNMLGKIIEKVSGKSYDQNLQELMSKTGMKSTSTASNYKGSHFSGSYTGNVSQPQAVENMPKRLDAKDIGVPAGGIISTVKDLAQWNTMLYGGKILKPETLELFQTQSAERPHPVFGKMGYGLGIMMNMNAPKAYFHSGYIKGSPSLLIYYPKTKTSVVILSNFADESKGKNAIFKPHQEIKAISDNTEKIVKQVRENILNET